VLDHPLARLGWRATLQDQFDSLGDPALVPARVIAVDRGRAVVDEARATHIEVVRRGFLRHFSEGEMRELAELWERVLPASGS
jgi:hypothetical protein